MANRAITFETASRPEIVALSERDLPDVAGFVGDQSGRERASVETHLRWFLLENPARQPQHPLGFGLFSAGELAGCILCCPQMFRLQASPILFMGSSSFYVDESHRGWGGRIFLNYCRLGNLGPLFGTSANSLAAGLWKAAGALPIPHSDGELFGIVHWPPVAEEVVHRWSPNPLLSRLARSPASRMAGWFRHLTVDGAASGDLQLLTAAQQVADLVARDSSEKLTADRGLAYIRWRYFSGRDASTAAFAFRSRRPDQDILVTVNQRSRGYRGQINTLNVLDIYPEVSPGEHVRIAAALLDRYGKMVDALVLRNQDPDQEAALTQRGFHKRVFDAPIGWLLDRSRLLPKACSYFVAADGDGLI